MRISKKFFDKIDTGIEIVKFLFFIVIIIAILFGFSYFLQLKCTKEDYAFCYFIIDKILPNLSITAYRFITSSLFTVVYFGAFWGLLMRGENNGLDMTKAKITYDEALKNRVSTLISIITWVLCIGVSLALGFSLGVYKADGYIIYSILEVILLRSLLALTGFGKIVEYNPLFALGVFLLSLLFTAWFVTLIVMSVIEMIRLVITLVLTVCAFGFFAFVFIMNNLDGF